MTRSIFSPMSRPPRTGQELGGIARSFVTGLNKSFGEAATKRDIRFKKMLELSGAGTAQKRLDVNVGSEQAMAKAQQQLARTGLSGSTINPTLQTGFERERQASLGRISGEAAREKISILGQQQTAGEAAERERLAGISQIGSTLIGARAKGLREGETAQERSAGEETARKRSIFNAFRSMNTRM